MTSESVNSEGMRASSGPTGSGTNVPSACGTRTASPWPPSSVVPPHHPPCRQDVCRPCWQNSQVPSDQANGATTRSPFFTIRTSVPMVSTTPMNSWPIRFPVSLVGIELYGQRSLPQIHARVTRTSASVGSTMRASGTVSTRTSCAPYITVARIQYLQSSATPWSSTVLFDAVGEHDVLPDAYPAGDGLTDLAGSDDDDDVLHGSASVRCWTRLKIVQ